MFSWLILTRFNLLVIFSLFSASSFGQLSEYVRFLDNWHDESIPKNGIGVRYNDTWGFTQNGQEYAVIGSTLGTHVFQVTTNHKLKSVAFVEGANSGFTVIHRDFKYHKGYLFAVCDQGASTLQIIDVRYLPDSVSVVFDSPIFSPITHNIFIDKNNDLLYMCATQTAAMKVVNISNPPTPILLYDFIDVAVVHDAYVRNNIAYLNCGNQGLRIYDFSNPTAPVLLGTLENYPESGYNHSGWLNESGDVYVFADENEGKRMKVCDVSDPSNIRVLSLFNSGSGPNAMPHNQMIKNDLVFVSHYKDGLQIFDVRNPERVQRVGYYETYPVKGPELFNGAWGIYCFLPSGRILVSDMSSGLFLLGFDDLPNIESAQHGVFPNPASGAEAYFYYYHKTSPVYNLYIFDSVGQLIESYSNETRDYTIINIESWANGMYYYKYESTKTGEVVGGKFQVMK
jgi:choice-of-anchor B domain-containing protein